MVKPVRAMPSVPAPDAEHYKDVAEAILEGTVVPFLGAGANLCGHSCEWDPLSRVRLPLGGELARYLAEQFGYSPRKFEATCTCHEDNNRHEFLEPADDLLRVSQYVAVVKDTIPLYKRLTQIFDDNYDPTPLHRLIASLPAKLADKLAEQGTDDPPHLLVVSTNYDDLMERAFEAAGEPFDVVYYMASGLNRGKFVHRAQSGSINVIAEPNNYPGLSLNHGSIIFKIHGEVHRTNADAKDDYHSYVITEDHYIEYLTHIDHNKIHPALLAKMKNSNFLFLGYSLRDWNLRAFLHRIWATRPDRCRSWAIQHKPELLEAKSWGKRDVDVFDEDLNEYVTQLSRQL